MAGQPCRRHSYCPNCHRPACSAYYCPARTALPGYSMYQALPALHHDIAAHQLDKLIGDGHAEARAAVFPRGLHGLLLERTENTADKRRLHTDAGVVYADHHIRYAVPQHHLPEGDNNFTLARKFDRIGQKIDDNLADAQLIAKDVIHGHTVKANLVADAAAVKVFRKHIVQPITTSGKCSPSISSQSVMCIPSPVKFRFYSFLCFSSSRYLHIHFYIIAPISVDLQHFSPMQPLSPTNFSPTKHKEDTEQYCSVSFCINSVLS